MKLSFLALLVCSLACAHAQTECHDVGTDHVILDPTCSDPTQPQDGCNAGGQGQNCRFCFANPDRCKATSPPTKPPFDGNCKPVDGHQTYTEPTCKLCNAGGQSQCKFCGDEFGFPCPGKTTTTKGTTVSGQTTTTTVPVTRPTTTAKTTTTAGPDVDRCTQPDPLSQTSCKKSELVSKCECDAGSYCCLDGPAAKGCSPNLWTAPACTCACKVEDFPIENCDWDGYLFAPCNTHIAPYFCPSSGGCAPQSFRCPDICYLPEVPPYPDRPVSPSKYTPSEILQPQDLVCGAKTMKPTPKCTVQPSDPSWPNIAYRKAQCAQNGWWCPDTPSGWKPSLYQCGPTMEKSDICPIATIQAEECRTAPGYVAPDWAPQPQSDGAYCDSTTDCDSIKDSAHCVGCCLWDNPRLKCMNFYENGAGASCRKVSPRWNWIITTCDTMGGQDFGGACQQNPFSRVDIRYVAAYQLVKNDLGQFVWRLDKASSLNWNGEEKYVDFSSLPTEHTGTGPVKSCSGGGGNWNAAFFPYKVDGVTPPAMMFVLSYDHFENAAWFMLNQRILDSGPATSTCKDMTNCWGEISAGEIDFLETPNLFPNKFKTPTGWNIFRTTSYNAANRCLACNHANHDGTINNGASGGEPSDSYYDANGETDDASKAHFWATVVDARGTTVYKDPVWPGMGPDCVAEELVNLHPAKPEQETPITDAKKTGAIFLPGCPTSYTPEMTQITNGDYERIPRCWVVDWAVHTTCTENWWDLMVDSGQWLIKDPDFTP